jgi:glycosyltransferase involved in cell wall biosynthesis
MKSISIVTPCFNEEENVVEVYERVKKIFSEHPAYKYEHIFIDNASTDRTVEKLREIAKSDKNVKVIINSRNFGHIRSPFYGLLQANGDAVILLVSDLQDPPELISQFISKWEEGHKVVLGIKAKSKENKLMFLFRKFCYRAIKKISDVTLINDFTGFGLYDKKIIDALRQIDDPYPYFRGLISEVGFKPYKIEFVQPARKRGKTKNNFYTLYDIGMLGVTSHSKVPMRIATLVGFALSFLSFIIAIAFFIAKIIFWNKFALGIAPIIIGLFFFSAIQLFFIGLLGEYVLSIQTRVMKRPLVIEEERINFD